MQTWLEVEIAACEAWASLGEIPPEAVAEIKAKAALRRRAGPGDRGGHAARRHRLPEQRRRVRGRRLQVHPLRHDLVGHARHRPGAAAQAGRRPAGRRRPGSWVGCSSDAPWNTATPLMIGRSHGVHAEPITFGMVLGLWAFEIHRGLERLERATERGGGGQDLGRRRHLRQRRPAGGGVRHGPAGPGGGAHLDAGGAARPARRVHVGPGPAGDQHREDRRPGASLPAHRGAGGRGVLRPRAEGLVGHAAQAQPHHLRAARGAGAGDPRQPDGRPRERAALARAGHLALQRRTHHPARFARSCCTTC